MVAEDGRPSRGKRNPRSHSTRLLFINQTGPTFYKLTQVKEEEEDRVAKVVVVFSAQAQIET